MKLQVFCVFSLALLVGAKAHNLPSYQQEWVQHDANYQDYVQGEQEEVDDGFEGVRDQGDDPANQDLSDGDSDEEDEGRKVYLMAMKESATEELIGGEFYEGPADGASPTDNERPRGKRSRPKGGAVDDLEMLLQEEGGGGEVVVMEQWNNHPHKLLNVQCPGGFGLHQMKSVFNADAKDRQFLFMCNRVAPLCLPGDDYNPAKRTCKWIKMNNIAVTGNVRCPSNNYLAGVQSKATCKHDREWHGLCCATPHLCYARCAWTGYLNNYRGALNYKTGGVFTGMISVYNPTVMDRRYRLQVCTMKAC